MKTKLQPTLAAKAPSKTGDNEVEIIVPTPVAQTRNPVDLLFDARGDFKTFIDQIDTATATGLTRYAVIALEAALQIRADSQLKRQFEVHCTDEKIKFKQTSDIFGQTARVLVGKKRPSQTSKVASINRFAASMKIPSAGLAQWIRDEGGWESAAAKASKRMRPKDITQERIKNAISWAKSAKPLAEFEGKSRVGSSGIYDGIGVSLVVAGNGNKIKTIDTFSSDAITKLVLLAYETKMSKSGAVKTQSKDAYSAVAAGQTAIAKAKVKEPAA